MPTLLSDPFICGTCHGAIYSAAELAEAMRALDAGGEPLAPCECSE